MLQSFALFLHFSNSPSLPNPEERLPRLEQSVPGLLPAVPVVMGAPFKDGSDWEPF